MKEVRVVKTKEDRRIKRGDMVFSRNEVDDFANRAKLVEGEETYALLRGGLTGQASGKVRSQGAPPRSGMQFS